MRVAPYYACCGANFFCDLTKEALEDRNMDVEKLPKIPDPTGWSKVGYPDWSKVGVALMIKQYPSHAYLFAIIKQEEKEIGKLLVEHGFKVISETKERLLYCKMREGSKPQ